VTASADATLDLRALRAFIFDLDGCVYTGRTLVPGVAELLAGLRASGRRLLFLTNNSRQDGVELAAKLAGLGITADPGEVLSAAEATGSYVAGRFGPSRLLAVGSATLLRGLTEAGHTLVSGDSPEAPRVVVMGHDGDFTYDKLARLARAVARGAAFVAVNRDPRLPLEGGDFLPGCGALAEAVAAASGVSPEIVGKPRPYLFRAAVQRLRIEPAQAVMIGDDLLADMHGARGVGLRTIWLAPRGAEAELVRPDLTIQHFAELTARLRS
jgi:HAD superfamily hydrolase (TIGR01450 family)